MARKCLLPLLFVSQSALAAVGPEWQDTTFFDTFTMTNDARSYYYYIPDAETYQMPLVLVFHGRNGHADGFFENLKCQMYADLYGMAVASVQALTITDALLGEEPRQWTIEGGPAILAQQHDDLGFVDQVIQEMKGKLTAAGHKLDKKRVYATGFSAGGAFTYHVASRRADVFAAVCAGGSAIPTSDVDDMPGGKVALLAYGGDQDDSMGYNGVRPQYFGTDLTYTIQETIQLFKGLNVTDMNFNFPPTIEDNDPVPDMCTAKRFVWDNALNGRSVELLRVYNGRHDVPNTDNTTPGHCNGFDMMAKAFPWFLLHSKP